MGKTVMTSNADINTKDHRSKREFTSLSLAHDVNLSQMREELIYFTKHDTKPFTVDLRPFRDGQHALDKQSPSFSGRPELISELFFAIYDRTNMHSRDTIRSLLWSLRHWWRVLDHAEKIMPSFGRVQSVSQLSEIHWQAALQLNIPSRAYTHFSLIVNITRIALDLPQLHWSAPHQPQKEKHLIPLNLGERIRHELKHRWFSALRRFEYIDVLRAQGRPITDPKKDKVLFNRETLVLATLENNQSETQMIPIIEELALSDDDAANYRKAVYNFTARPSAFRAVLYPNTEDIRNAFYLCLANNGLNVAVLLDLDIRKKHLLEHPKDPSRFIFRGLKKRAGDTEQIVEGLFKSRGCIGYILSFLIKRTAPLREILFNRLDAEKKKFSAMLKSSPLSSEIAQLSSRIATLEAGTRSPWLYCSQGNICWLTTDNYSRAKSGGIFLRNLVRRLNKNSPPEKKIPTVTGRDFRDMFAYRTMILSGGSILAVKAALGHRKVTSTMTYVKNNLLKEEHRKVFLTFSKALWDGICERQEIDPTILAKFLKDGTVSNEDRALLADYRKLHRSRIGIGCFDPHHPSKNVAPHFQPDGHRQCPTQRCILCDKSILLPDSEDGLCQRYTELEYLQQTMSYQAFLESSYPEEIERLDIALQGYSQDSVQSNIKKWRDRIQKGTHRHFEFMAP